VPTAVTAGRSRVKVEAHRHRAGRATSAPAPRSTVKTIVTVVGNVVDSPRRANTATGTVTNFRMASNDRRFDQGTEQWVDSGTLWIDIECWSALSNNVAASISKGDPVIVHGTLSTHTWESENGPRSKPRIKAAAVGLNLSKGRAVFTRDQAARSAEPADEYASGPLSPAAEGTPDDQFLASDEELQAGRDYVGEDEALYGADADDLSREPAHA
jgi:single-strand DNA-binding protein